MADTTEKLDIVFNVTGLEESNAKLVQANSSVEKLFRQLSETGEEIETPFLKGIDSINRLRGNLDDVTDQLRIFGASGAKAADALEGISDPTLRMAEASRLLQQGMRDSASPLANASNQLHVYQARLASIPTPLKAAAAGQLALAGIAGGILVKSIQAAAKADADLAKQLEVLDKSSNKALASLSKFAIGDGGLRGVTNASSSASGALDKLGSTLDDLEDSGTAGFIVVNNIKTALTAIVAGPLTPMITGVRLLNKAFGEGEDAIKKFNTELVANLRLQAAQEINAEKQKKFEDAILKNEKARLGGLKYGAEAHKTSQVFIGDTELSTTAAEKYQEALAKFNAEQRENLALREELIPLLGKEKALKLGLLKEEEKKKGSGGETEAEKMLKRLGDAIEETARKTDTEAKRIQRDLQAIADMERNFQETKQLSGGNQILIDKYKDDPTVQAFEKLKADMQAANAEAGELSFINAEKLAEVDAGTKQVMQLNAAMNDAAQGALMLGVNMAAMALETAVAGDSFAGFGWKMLQMFGSFASQAGQVILAAGIGELALFQGNPVGAIGAGLGLIALGAVLGGVAKRNLKQGAAPNQAATNQIVDRFAQNNRRNEDNEPQPIIVYAQFGTERLEPAIANAYTNAQRNGRLPRN